MTHHDPDEVGPPRDSRLAGLLGALTDDDFARVDPPDDVFAGIVARRAGTPAPLADPAPVVVSLNDRRRAPRAFAAVAAAVVLVVGVSIVVLATRTSTPTRRLLASAELEQLEPLGRTAATAKLVEEDGRTHLVIDASDMAPPPAGSSYELWLIDRGVTDPRSLGVVTGSEDVVVPSSIDTSEYAIVDISLEPDDGDHAHSGHSLMRGTLT